MKSTLAWCLEPQFYCPETDEVQRLRRKQEGGSVRQEIRDNFNRMRIKALQMRDAGLTDTDISKRLEVSVDSVRRALGKK